jgi:hypothetical protein
MTTRGAANLACFGGACVVFVAALRGFSAIELKEYDA